MSRRENGKFVAPAERASRFPDAFDLPAVADTGVVWLHFQSAYPLPRHSAPALLPFQKEEYAVWRQEESGSRQSVLYGWGAAQGTMLAFMIFPLALFWLNRQPYYLYYMAYVILVAANDQLDKLTPRELSVLQSLSRGNSYKMVGVELGIGIETVRTHIKRIYEKLHVHSVAEAIAKVFLR